MRTAMGLLALMALVMTGSAGCSASGSSTTISEGHWRIALPEGWTSATPQGKPWTKAYAKDGVTMQIAGGYSEDVTSRAALTRLELPAQTGLQAYAPEDTRDPKVEGAYDSLLRRYSYTEKGARREGVWILASQYPYPQVSAISLSGERIEPSLLDELVSGLRFEKTQG